MSKLTRDGTAKLLIALYGVDAEEDSTHVSKYLGGSNAPMLHEAAKRIAELEELVSHCWLYSGYQDCGSRNMTTEQRELYESISQEDCEKQSKRWEIIR